jgi:hypothetical protein
LFDLGGNWLKINKTTDHREETNNIKIWTMVIIIAFFLIFVVSYCEDNNMVKEINVDIIETEKLLDAYLTENQGISEGFLIEIDLEEKVRKRYVHDSRGITESVDLNKDYYRIPGIIDVLVDSKLDGDFICDVEGKVYYIHNKAID